MTNEVTTVLGFNEDEVDMNNLTASLLRLCSQHGKLSATRFAEIRSQLDEIFSENAAQVTKRSSSTIPKSIAEKLYGSILFQCDAYLLSLPNLSAAVNVLCSTPMNEIVNFGKTLILRYYYESKVIYEKAKQNMPDINIFEYRQAMSKAFNIYYKSYDGRFNAQDAAISVDYPVLFGNFNGEKGVLFVKKYYSAIHTENEICQLITSEELHQLLECYGKIYGCEYRKLLFNVCEVVLNNMFACALLDKDTLSVELAPSDIKKLYGTLQYSSQEVSEMARKSFMPFYRLVKKPTVISYMRRYLPQFSHLLWEHSQNKTLESFLCVNN